MENNASEKQRKIETIFLFISPKKKSMEQLSHIEKTIRDAGLQIIGQAEVFRDKEPELDGVENVDLAISIGGDGTILRISRLVGDIPILGVNTGRIGFLTEVFPSKFEEILEKIKKGKFRVENVHKLGGRIIYPNENEKKLPPALNEYLITSQRQGKILHLQLSINDIPITKWRGDGVILASALGSTAYSFSEGGSVLLPEMKSYILTPLVPLWRKMRPIVLSQSEKVSIKILERGWEGIIVPDGTENYNLPTSSEINIWVSEHITKFLRVQHRFQTLSKLFTYI